MLSLLVDSEEWFEFQYIISSQDKFRQILRQPQIMWQSQFLSYYYNFAQLQICSFKMYDINRETKVGLCAMSNNAVCYYLPQSKNIQAIQKKYNHYQNQNQIVPLVQEILTQLFYYSNSRQKLASKSQEPQILEILLKNVKKITVHNCDKYGLIIQQKLFFLVVSYLHSRVNKVNNLREYLNQVHYFLTSSSWSNPQEQLPFSLLMLLNGQFQQLLDYSKQNLALNCHPQMVQNLIDLLVSKIEENQDQSKPSTAKIHVQKINKHINQSDWVKKLLSQTKKKNQNLFTLFSSKHEIQIILAVLAGNQSIIEELAKGSWGLYLNLYINYADSLRPNTQHIKSYENSVKNYLNKYFSGNKNNQFLNKNQQFLLKVLNSSIQSNKFSFHEVYQSTFNIFSPILCHLIGLLLLQCHVIDLYSIFNNKEYYEEILMGLLQSCSQTSWLSLVYMMGFMENSSFFKDQNSKQVLWESLLAQYLPYEFDLCRQDHDLLGQVKLIESKIQDLHLIGLSFIAKSYLKTFFKLQLRDVNSNGKLNQQILQLFFLNLESSDQVNVSQCFHLMKSFMSRYYRDYAFDYGILDNLQSIFERKQSIISQKMGNKIEKLFSLIYKIKIINQLGQMESQSEKNNRQSVIAQILEFNKLFITGKNKKSVSLCVDLLKLATWLHKKIQSDFTIAERFSDDNQSDINEQYNQFTQKTLKQFQRNTLNYFKEWKKYIGQVSKGQKLPQVIEHLNYLQKSLY